MTNHHSSSNASHPRTAVRWSLAWLFLALSAALSFAGGGPINPTPIPDPSVSGGEEGTSLPMVNDVSGLTFVGSLRELRGLDLVIQGQGRMDVTRLPNRTLALTFVGDFRIGVDRLALARSNVSVLFRGGDAFANGVARLQVGGTTTVLDSERVPLPVVRLAAQPRAMGQLVTLDVFSPVPHQAHLVASFDTQRVTLFQRMR
jgi:hypothetical protein